MTVWSSSTTTSPLYYRSRYSRRTVAIASAFVVHYVLSIECGTWSCRGIVPRFWQFWYFSAVSFLVVLARRWRRIRSSKEDLRTRSATERSLVLSSSALDLLTDFSVKQSVSLSINLYMALLSWCLGHQPMEHPIKADLETGQAIFWHMYACFCRSTHILNICFISFFFN